MEQAAGFLTFGQNNKKETKIDSSKSTQKQYFDKFESNNQQQMPMQNMGAFLPSPANTQTEDEANSFSL